MTDMTGRPGRAAIIGASGRMGAWLASGLTRAGWAVQGADRSADRPLDAGVLRRACADADIAVLCVPAHAMDEVAALAAPHLRPDAVLADITSVKLLPLRAMKTRHAGPVVGTHPLFGPTPKPGDLRVCVTPDPDPADPVAHAAALALVERLFVDLGCSTFRASPEEHDRAMAAIQGLNFVTSVAYFAMLSRHPDFEPFLTPSFRRRLESARSLLTTDAELFAGLVAANPLSQDVTREYRSYLNVAAGGDVDVLAQLARWWFRNEETG